MTYGIDEKSEEMLNNFLESITIVDDDYNTLPVVLEKDGSDDPEGDREGV